MPLYLDRHDLPDGVTAEAVALAHVRDPQVQDRYGAHYLSYWFDYDRQVAFCLVKAPSKVAAEAVDTERRTASSRPASLRSIPGGSMSSSTLSRRPSLPNRTWRPPSQRSCLPMWRARPR